MIGGLTVALDGTITLDVEDHGDPVRRLGLDADEAEVLGRNLIRAARAARTITIREV